MVLLASSRLGTLSSNWPPARSSVTCRPLISTPCTSTALSATTGSSATASTRVPSTMRRCRATYSTRSELAKLTTGALMTSVDTGCSITVAKKPAGSCTTCWLQPGSDDARVLPVLSSTATNRTMRFWRAEPRSRWLAVLVSTHVVMELDRSSSSSMLAKSTSTASSERFSAASAPATKRVACSSPSLRATLRAFQASAIATSTTAAANSATPSQTAALMRAGWDGSLITCQGSPPGHARARWSDSTLWRSVRHSAATSAATRWMRGSPGAGARLVPTWPPRSSNPWCPPRR